MTSVAVSYDEFKKMGVEVLTISTDSPYAHKVWFETELSKMSPMGIPFPMLSDPNGNIGRMYGVYNEQHGMDGRATFVIDHNGTIQMSEMLAAGVGRSTEEILRRIKAMQLSLSSGQATPADWKEGKKTLNPNPGLAGHVYEVWQAEKELVTV